MRLLWDKDTKTLAGGAGFALACGILLGGAMQPSLGDDGRPAGPQQIAGWSGVRSTGPFDPGMSPASYGGVVPDYVTGTDWKKTPAGPDEQAAVAPPSRRVAVADETPAAQDDAQTAPATRADFYAPPPARPGYPSLGGGRASGAADEPADAPADATG
jgi:hypothetical protein